LHRILDPTYLTPTAIPIEMSTVDSEIGCALRPDSSLKDASEIEWICDKDEIISFPSKTSVDTAAMSSSHVVETGKSDQILKSAYRNGDISAVTQAAEHLDPLIMSIDAEDSTDEVWICRFAFLKYISFGSRFEPPSDRDRTIQEPNLPFGSPFEQSY